MILDNLSFTISDVYSLFDVYARKHCSCDYFVLYAKHLVQTDEIFVADKFMETFIKYCRKVC